MKPPFFAALAAAFLFVSCAGKSGGTDVLFRTGNGDGPAAQELISRYMPGTKAAGAVKIAVVSGIAADDYTSGFLEGCVSEGRAMGFTVDSFVSGGRERRDPLVFRIAQADYDGLILYGREAVLTDEPPRTTLENGMKIVTVNAPGFDSDPSLVGGLCMRILAAKLAGEDAPDACVLDGRLFNDYPWMTELKNAERDIFRLSGARLKHGREVR